MAPLSFSLVLLVASGLAFATATPFLSSLRSIAAVASNLLGSQQSSPAIVKSQNNAPPLPVGFQLNNNLVGLLKTIPTNPTDLGNDINTINLVLFQGFVYIQLLGTNNSEVGIISVSLDLQCSLSKFLPEPFATYERFIACAICNTDAIYGHNKYGGSCGVDRSYPPGQQSHQTCVCADTQANATCRGLTENSATTCGNPFGSATNDAVNLFFLTVIRSRYDAVLCVPGLVDPTNTTAVSISRNQNCAEECHINHGYVTGGECVSQIPNLGVALQEEDPFFEARAPYQAFCLCLNYIVDPNDVDSCNPASNSTSSGSGGYGSGSDAGSGSYSGSGSNSGY